MLATIAQAGPLPSLDHWMVWGPLAVFFAVSIAVGLDYYRSEVKPRAKQRRENDQRLAEKQSAYLETAGVAIEKLGDNSDRLAAGVQAIQDEQVRQRDEQLRQGGEIKEHGKRISDIWRHIKGSDPDRSAIEE